MALLIACVSLASAQMVDPVKWKTSQRLTSDTEGVITFSCTIDKGWHMYSLDCNPNAGPSPLSIDFDTLKGVKLKGKPRPSKRSHTQMDDMFEAELSWWEGSVTITQKFEVTAADYAIDGQLKFMACNDENCTMGSSPFNLKGSAPGFGAVAAAEEEPQAADTFAAVADTAAADTAAVAAAPVPAGDVDLWAPVKAVDGEEDTSSTSLWWIFLACFGGGFIALLTPCVWPMIPMTVSFFLKTGGSRAKSIRDALTYGVSIIVIYVALGLVVSAAFGASALNALSTNAVVNIIFFLLLVVFAVSFFGAFDITLPESWSNKIDSKAEKTTGLLSIFFMAFTLTLVSFSCTGPIIGTLLVEAAGTGSMMGPAVGMFGFALALAIPFALFAMFPSMLSSMPSSGGWMNTVKVVLGFLELALSLKFLSVADLAYGWHILDREVFVVLWIAIFVLLALYLLGIFNFSHYGKADGSVGVGRFFMSLISLAFAAYLLPGLWGAPLKSVSAFVPPLFTQDFNLYGGELEEYDNYDEGMRVAATQNRPVLIDFSGYGCVNCRKMEAAVLDNADVRRAIEENFVVIKLMVDEKKEMPEHVTVTENGAQVKLKTYGDYWSYLQRYKFNANAQPYYVVLDNQGQMLSGPFVYKEDIPGFLKFLERGIESYKK